MSKEDKVQENKMGVMPVNKLLLSMSVPMMLSMLVQALYNVVDSIFVARVSEEALTAVSLAFPLQTLLIAFSGGMCESLEDFKKMFTFLLGSDTILLLYKKKGKER